MTAGVTTMTTLPPGIWFARSRRGRGYAPVTREGWRVSLLFLVFMIAAGGLAGLLIALTGEVAWIALFGVGAAVSGAWFIATARRHGDLSIDAADIFNARRARRAQSAGQVPDRPAPNDLTPET